MLSLFLSFSPLFFEVLLLSFWVRQHRCPADTFPRQLQNMLVLFALYQPTSWIPVELAPLRGRQEEHIDHTYQVVARTSPTEVLDWMAWLLRLYQQSYPPWALRLVSGLLLGKLLRSVPSWRESQCRARCGYYDLVYWWEWMLLGTHWQWPSSTPLRTSVHNRTPLSSINRWMLWPIGCDFFSTAINNGLPAQTIWWATRVTGTQ